MPRTGENIYKRKDGRWEARYIHHYENGKAKYRYIYGESYADVKEKRAEELELPDYNDLPTSKRLATMETIAKLWLAENKASIKESSYTRYYRIIRRYLLPLFGKQMLTELNPKIFNNLPERLLKEGGINKTGLSPKTVSDILCVLKSILNYGRENGYPVPVIKSLKYPQGTSREIKILSSELRKKMESQLMKSEDLLSLGLIFTLFTGVRIGELCGLRWGDIDFDASVVSIERTITRIDDLDPRTRRKTKVVITEPKTQSSIRIIPLQSFLLAYLKDRRQEDDCYLLTGNCCYKEPHCYYAEYKSYLRKNGMEDHTFHELRHTFATRCVELGFDTKSLSEILGHSSITTTLSVYVHPTLQQKKQQMEMLAPSEPEAPETSPEAAPKKFSNRPDKSFRKKSKH